jgi:sigma-B regulation protein RsbU (phosphoserine phosphatase)
VPLGVQASARYDEHEAAFGPGDVLFASTDGLIEARRGGAFFGEQRLPAVLAEHGRALGPRELVGVVYREVEAWAPQLDDDVVILALRPQP